MYQACIVCSCCRQWILGHGTLWLWSHRPVLVKAKILLILKCIEAEATLVSKATTRAARRSAICSTFAVLFVMVVAGCVSDKILFSNLVNPCTSMGIDARLASICESVLARMASILSLQSNLRSEHPLHRDERRDERLLSMSETPSHHITTKHKPSPTAALDTACTPQPVSILPAKHYLTHKFPSHAAYLSSSCVSLASRESIRARVSSK